MGGVAGRTGKYIRTNETKEKIRLSKLGDKNPMFGKVTSIEVRKKISDKLKGKIPKNWYRFLLTMIYRTR